MPHPFILILLVNVLVIILYFKKIQWRNWQRWTINQTDTFDKLTFLKIWDCHLAIVCQIHIHQRRASKMLPLISMIKLPQTNLLIFHSLYIYIKTIVTNYIKIILLWLLKGLIYTTQNTIFSVTWNFISLWSLFGWHSLRTCAQILSRMMDDGWVHPKPYLLLSATCDEMLS